MVHHLAIYRNMEAVGKGMALQSAASVTGSVVVDTSTPKPNPGAAYSTLESGSIEAMSGKAEWRLAEFSQAENPNRLVCYIVFIDSEYQGRRVVTRTLMSITNLNDFNTVIPRAVESAVSYHLSL